MSVEWKQVEEARFDEMMSVLPPAMYSSHGFLVGEPHDHRKCKVMGHTASTYAAFVSLDGKFYEGPPMTAAEFRALKIEAVLA